MHLWLSLSGSASEAADVCKVPFRRHATAAVTAADPAKVSPESHKRKHSSPLCDMQQAASLKWSAAEIGKIWVQVCEWDTHPHTVPLPRSYCCNDHRGVKRLHGLRSCIQLNTVVTPHMSAKYCYGKTVYINI